MKWLRTSLPHLFVLIAVSAIILSSGQSRLWNVILDTRFQFLTRPATGSIALIAIDSQSIERIGVWPWPRSLHARMVDQLLSAKVADIVFDVDFSSPSSPAEDEAMAAALQRADGSVVLASFVQRLRKSVKISDLHVNKPIKIFEDASWSGLVNVFPDADGISRSYSYGGYVNGVLQPSVGTFLAGETNLRDGSFRIDFGIDAASVPVVSYSDVLDAEPHALAALAGKKVIISGTAAELGDQINVPNGKIIPGSLLQALAAESLIQGRALSTWPLAGWLGFAFVTLLMFGLWSRTSATTRTYLLVGVALAAEVSAWILQSCTAIALDTSLLLATCAIYAVAVGFAELDLRALLKHIAERRFFHVAMSLNDGLICLDQRGLITFWNAAAQTIFGYEAQDILGRNFRTLLSPPDADEATTSSAHLATWDSGLLQEQPLPQEASGYRKNGEVFDLEYSISQWVGSDGPQFGIVLRDVTLRNRQQAQIKYLAECDVLTGLPNRNSLIVELEDRYAEKSGPQDHELILISLLKLAQASKLQGQKFGDALMQATASRLQAICGPGNFLARLGDHEFAVVILSGADCGGAVTALDIMTELHGAPIAIDQQMFRNTVAVGTSLRSAAPTPEEWLANSLFALGAAKSSESSAPVAFSPDMRTSLENRLQLQEDLATALVRDEFELFYQPQISMSDGRLIGAEALIRWRHPQRGLVSPAEFIPVVNTTSLSEPVSEWVLKTACRQAAAWMRMGFPIRIGVNTCQSQFTTGSLLLDVKKCLAETGLPAHLLEIEVTEDVILEKIDTVQTMLTALRDLGVKVAFDDFGTGYGSLTYLKAFPLDTIKIDQSFVRHLRDNMGDMAIVSTTIQLSNALGLSVIAEGIETREVADMLRVMGCNEGQGYYFSKPLPARDFEQKYFSQIAKVA